MSKADKTESLKRLYTIEQWLIDGMSHYEIGQYASKLWGIGLRQCHRYIKLAYEKIEEAYTEQLKDKIGWHHTARRKLYKKAVSENKLNIAAGILKDMADLAGMYKIKIVGDENEPLVIKDVKFNLKDE